MHRRQPKWNESYGLQFKRCGTPHGVDGHLQHGALLNFQREPLSVLGLRRPGGFLVSYQIFSYDLEDPGRLERWWNVDCEGNPPIRIVCSVHQSLGRKIAGGSSHFMS